MQSSYLDTGFGPGQDHAPYNIVPLEELNNIDNVVGHEPKMLGPAYKWEHEPEFRSSSMSLYKFMEEEATSRMGFDIREHFYNLKKSQGLKLVLKILYYTAVVAYIAAFITAGLFYHFHVDSNAYSVGIIIGVFLGTFILSVGLFTSMRSTRSTKFFKSDTEKFLHDPTVNTTTNKFGPSSIAKKIAALNSDTELKCSTLSQKDGLRSPPQRIFAADKNTYALEDAWSPHDDVMGDSVLHVNRGSSEYDGFVAAAKALSVPNFPPRHTYSVPALGGEFHRYGHTTQDIERFFHRGNSRKKNDWFGAFDFSRNKTSQKSSVWDQAAKFIARFQPKFCAVINNPVAIVSSILRNILFCSTGIAKLCFLHRASNLLPWESKDTPTLLIALDVALMWSMMIDHIACLSSSSNKVGFVLKFRSLVDIATLSPLDVIVLHYWGVDIGNYTSIVRLLRLGRLEYLLNRSLLAVDTVWIVLIGLLFDCSILILIYALLIYMIEAPHGSFINILHFIYFSVVTLTTIGYGDYSPTTTAGRCCAIACMLGGFILLPYQAQRLITAINEPALELGHIPSHYDNFIMIYGRVMPKQLGTIIHELMTAYPGSLHYVFVITPTSAEHFKPLINTAWREYRVRLSVTQKYPSARELHIYCSAARAVYIVSDTSISEDHTSTSNDLLAEDQRTFLRLTKVQCWCWPDIPVSVQLAHGYYKGLLRELGAYKTFAFESLKLRCIAKSISNCEGFVPLVFNWFHSFSARSMFIELYNELESRRPMLERRLDQNANSFMLRKGSEADHYRHQSHGLLGPLFKRSEDQSDDESTQDDSDRKLMQEAVDELNLLHYIRGLRYHAYRCPFPHCFDTLDFSLITWILFAKYNVYLLGFIGVNRSVYFNPAGFHVPANDQVRVVGLVLAPSLEIVKQISSLKTFYVSPSAIDRGRVSLAKALRSQDDLLSAAYQFGRDINNYRARQAKERMENQARAESFSRKPAQRDVLIDRYMSDVNFNRNFDAFQKSNYDSKFNHLASPTGGRPRRHSLGSMSISNQQSYGGGLRAGYRRYISDDGNKLLTGQKHKYSSKHFKSQAQAPQHSITLIEAHLTTNDHDSSPKRSPIGEQPSVRSDDDLISNTSPVRNGKRASIASMPVDDSGFSSDSSSNSKSSSYSSEDFCFIREALCLQDIVKNHNPSQRYLLCCGWPHDVQLFLQSIHINCDAFLVILAPEDAPGDTRYGKDLKPYSECTFWVRGSPLNLEDLKDAGVLISDSIVIFSVSHGYNDGDGHVQTKPALSNNQALLVRQQILALFVRVKDYLEYTDDASRLKIPSIILELHTRQSSELLESARDRFVLRALRPLAGSSRGGTATKFLYASHNAHDEDVETQVAHEARYLANSRSRKYTASDFDATSFWVNPDYRSGNLFVSELMNTMMFHGPPISRFAPDCSFIEQLADSTGAPIYDHVSSHDLKSEDLMKYAWEGPLKLEKPSIPFTQCTFSDVFMHYYRTHFKIPIGIRRKLIYTSDPNILINPIEFSTVNGEQEIVISCPSPDTPVFPSDQFYTIEPCPKHLLGALIL